MERETRAGAPHMVSLIEPVPLKHIESSVEIERRLLHDLADSGGCTGPVDEGISCYFMSPLDDLDDLFDTCEGFEPSLSDTQRVLKEAIGVVWFLK